MYFQCVVTYVCIYGVFLFFLVGKGEGKVAGNSMSSVVVRRGGEGGGSGVRETGEGLEVPGGAK